MERYLARIRHYATVDVRIIKPEKITKKIDEETIRRKEGQRILESLERQSLTLAWDERGRQLDSIGFADFLQEIRLSGRNLSMIVGGPLGLSDEVRRKADHILSLSKMTFPHDLARLLIVEQLYRAFTILRGEPYHK